MRGSGIGRIRVGSFVPCAILRSFSYSISNAERTSRKITRASGLRAARIGHRIQPVNVASLLVLLRCFRSPRTFKVDLIRALGVCAVPVTLSLTGVNERPVPAPVPVPVPVPVVR